ncbi:MAG: hypothetical protein ACKPEQ_28650, partial [Dolichospermum sp.]
LDTSLENLSSHLEKDEYLNNIAELSSLNQQIQVFNSRFAEIETSIESDHQNNLQQLTELSNNQQNQNRELSQINQQIAVINSRLTEIDNSTEKLHQT